MDLKVNHNSFIKLKEFFRLLDISVEVDEYNVKNDLLEGVLLVKGKYLKRDNVTEEYFYEKIPFTVAFATSGFDVEDIDCLDLEYVAIDGRGVDVSFDILIKYDDFSFNDAVEVPVEIVTQREKEVIESQTISLLEEDNLEKELEKELQTSELSDSDYEELKNEETKRIDNLLKSTLEIKDDNLPTEEVVIRGLKDDKSNISVCYYNSDSELEKVCTDKGISLDKVFKSNQKYNINQYHRVIINEK